MWAEEGENGRGKGEEKEVEGGGHSQVARAVSDQPLI